MPSITLATSTAQGPLASVVITASWPRLQALQAANLPAPTPTTGIFLIDTGASQTVVDKGLLAPLGLTPTGSVQVHTPSTGSTPHTCDQYDVALLIPGQVSGDTGWLIEAMPVIESDFSAQNIQGLIGRDLLSRAVLIHNGPANTFTLAY